MRKLKDNKNNTTTTITPSTSDKTPIEIALQIDSDGMTTLSKLYNFLEINPSNYSRWCRKNIINNPFANEGYDYIEVPEITRLNVPNLFTSANEMNTYIRMYNSLEAIDKYRISLKPKVEIININNFMLREFTV